MQGYLTGSYFESHRQGRKSGGEPAFLTPSCLDLSRDLSQKKLRRAKKLNSPGVSGSGRRVYPRS
jgi:hypothetical protein